MTVLVNRTCTDVTDRDPGIARGKTGRPLADFRPEPAFVLLGDPGAGKTTCFEQECEALGRSAVLISARDFVTLSDSSHPEWQEKTLFIDGLDEIRAGDDDLRTALDRVRAQLDRLGPPRFRLSCREADWLGRNDQTRLQAVAPSGESPKQELRVLRLDPLTPENVELVAAADFRVGDAAGFLQEAKDKGLYGLLTNPQNLTLLIEAVGGGNDWPASRLEIFELASRRLAAEQNREHYHADRARAAGGELLEAAGRICALLLLSDTPGVVLSAPGSEVVGIHLAIERLDPPAEGTSSGQAREDLSLQRLALHSRLFATTPGGTSIEQRIEPVHRHMAEFLAGRYLAKRIRLGLPAARAISLIVAGDGGVVSQHRGLSAWLAAHSDQARSELIERDPIAHGLYGDIAGFSDAEKRSLLQALTREGMRLHSVGIRSEFMFAPLAAPTLEATFRHRLTSRPRNDDDQLAVEFLLRVLRRGEPLASLVDPVLTLVRQPFWWPRVTLAALDAFIRQCEGSQRRTAELKRLLADVQDGTVPDPDNQLAATILNQLYPHTIGPSGIWGHLNRCRPTSLFGRHRRFWDRTLEEKTSDSDLPALLDGLAQQHPKLELVREGLPHGRALAERLLARGLALHGSGLTPTRLYDWLNAPAQIYTDFHELSESRAALESSAQVRAWLEKHPAAYKAALLEGLRRYTDERDLGHGALLAPEWLRGAKAPPDFDRWCETQAQDESASRPTLARWLLSQAQMYKKYKEHLRDDPFPESPGSRHDTENEVREQVRRHEAADKAYQAEHKRREQTWLDKARDEANALRQNRGDPALLHNLAREWLQQSRTSSTPVYDWLHRKFDDEHDLAVAVYRSFRRVFEREDLPDAAEILRLHGQARMHYLSMPALAALADMEREGNRSVDALPKEHRRLALALYWCVQTNRNRHPDWYQRLIAGEPELVQSILLPYIGGELRRGQEYVQFIDQLAYHASHAELARLVSVPLLRGFPVRCHRRQFPNLIRLLRAALQHADTSDLRSVIEKKLTSKGMTVGQRVHWLVAGLIAVPAAYIRHLDEYLDGKQLRARELARFLWFDAEDAPGIDSLPADALRILIRHAGRAFGRVEIQDGPVGLDQETTWKLPNLIQLLADSPEPEAASALTDLVNDEALDPWRYHLRLARDRQTVVARDSSYRRPEIDQVRATLDDLAPANAADLAALALHRIDEVARSIRHANTNDWSQYWNQDGHGRPTDPKPENACRDALLSQLRQRLPAEVDAQPEGQYAASRRADIRLSCLGFHVPIEIKRQSHPALYRAARDQLVARYARDPATGGHGIFLALWFGDPDQAPVDDTGTRPGTPEELRQRLEAVLAQQLPRDQLRKIAVRVIDVSKP